MYVKAARIIQPKQPLQVQQMETPKPKGPQVLVKILYQEFVIVISIFGKTVTTAWAGSS
jgi:hypothetical protein